MYPAATEQSRTKDERERRPEREGAGRCGVMRIMLAYERVQDVDQAGESDGKINDRSVLPAQERLGARLDGVRDLPHFWRAGVPFHDITDQIRGKQQAQNAYAQDQDQVYFHMNRITPFYRM